MTFSEAILLAKNSTRIALFAPPMFADFLLHCLNFHGKTFSFYSNSQQHVFETDFHVFQTENPEEFNLIQPNIALIIDDANVDFNDLNLENIVNGGVLIYNENIEEKISATQGFFRKLPFEKARIKIDNNQKFLETDFSDIPMQISEELLQENILGLKLLCQQMQIMEEDFYEALMEFEVIK